MTNNIKLLYTIVYLLRKAEVNSVVFGGWAEELAGVIEPREHKDIDLLFFSQDFAKVDFFISNNKYIVEIAAKRFPHKRGFIFHGVLIEILLIKKNGHFLTTSFWDSLNINWPTFPSQKIELPNLGFVDIVDPNMITFYRSKHFEIKAIREKQRFLEKAHL